MPKPDDYIKTIRMLKSKGYKEYPPSRFDQYIERCWQKRFDDKIGKKYFIDVKMYPGLMHPHTKEQHQPSFEYDIYLTQKDNNCPILMRFYAGWTVEQVEAHAEKLFASGEYKYYEFWDEN